MTAPCNPRVSADVIWPPSCPQMIWDICRFECPHIFTRLEGYQFKLKRKTVSLSKGEKRRISPCPWGQLSSLALINYLSLYILQLRIQSVIALSVYVLKQLQVSMVTLYPSTEELSFCLPGQKIKPRSLEREHPHIQEAHQRQNQKPLTESQQWGIWCGEDLSREIFFP